MKSQYNHWYEVYVNFCWTKNQQEFKEECGKIFCTINLNQSDDYTRRDFVPQYSAAVLE